MGLAQPTSTPSSCARSVKAKMPFLCRFTKKGRKKGNQRLPPLETAPSAVLKKERRKGEVLQSSSICVAYIPPRRWVRRAKAFDVSFLFQLSSVIGREAKIDAPHKSKVRATSVSATFFKSHSQKLKLPAFAPCCEIYLARNGARTRGSKGESP